MKYNELKAPKQRSKSRVGRGISAGRGKTAGRGTKGQGARKSPMRSGFEGGQTPIHMRLPKLRGFKSKKTAPEVVYTGQLEALKPTVIDNKVLAEAGLVTSPYSNVKLIFNGQIKGKKTVKLQTASGSSIQALEKSGGSFEQVSRQARSSSKHSKE